MTAERNQNDINSVCFLCSHWQPIKDEDVARRDELLEREIVYAPPAIDGTCEAVKNQKTYLLTRDGYAPVESSSYKTTPQSPCSVGIKVKRKFIHAFEPHPKLKKST